MNLYESIPNTLDDFYSWSSSVLHQIDEIREWRNRMMLIRTSNLSHYTGATQILMYKYMIKNLKLTEGMYS